MTVARWPLRASRAGAGALGYDAGTWRDILGAARRRPAASLTVTGLLSLGVGLLGIGVGPGVFVLGVGLLATGVVDRRLVLLITIVLTPGLTAFNAVELGRVGAGTLDVRLALTAVTGGALWFWLSLDRPAVTLTARLFALYLLAVLLLAALNRVAPLHALPVLARDLVYLGTFIAAQAWLGTRRGVNAVLIAAVVGLAAPAAVGVLQWATGGGLVAAGGWRLTGSYGSSPVGMALAMQLGVVCLAGAALTEGFSVRLRWAAGIVVLAVMAVLLAQTSTRLPFVTTVAAVAVFELARRRWLGVVLVGVLAAVLLGTSAGLADRVASTFQPQPPPVATHGVPHTPAASARPGEPDDLGGADVGGGGASLRYRLFVWRTMADEWLRSPLLGHGTGSFATLLEQRGGARRVAPHNDYLYALVEGGIVLLLLYVSLQVVVVAALVRAVVLAGDARLAVVAACVFGATNIANSINNAVFYPDQQVIVWAISASVLVVSAAEVRGRSVREVLTRWRAALAPA